MSIWFAPFTLEEVNARGATCANGHLGMELIEIGDDYLRGRMPVDQRTRQPAGALHGQQIQRTAAAGSSGSFTS